MRRTYDIQRAISETFFMTGCFWGARGPGAVIKHLSKDTRDALKNLKSSDIQQVPEWMEKARRKKHGS